MVLLRDYRRQPSEHELLRESSAGNSLPSPSAADPRTRAAADAFATLGFDDRRPSESLGAEAHPQQQGPPCSTDLRSESPVPPAASEQSLPEGAAGEEARGPATMEAAVKVTELQQASAAAQSRLAPAKLAGPSAQVAYYSCYREVSSKAHDHVPGS